MNKALAASLIASWAMTAVVVLLNMDRMERPEDYRGTGWTRTLIAQAWLWGASGSWLVLAAALSGECWRAGAGAPADLGLTGAHTATVVWAGWMVARGFRPLKEAVLWQSDREAAAARLSGDTVVLLIAAEAAITGGISITGLMTLTALGGGCETPPPLTQVVIAAVSAVGIYRTGLLMGPLAETIDSTIQEVEVERRKALAVYARLAAASGRRNKK